MEAIRNIVIISKDDSATLTTQIEPVKTAFPLEMAVTSVTHGPLPNVNERNSKIKFSSDLLITERTGDFRPIQYSANIPSGHYHDTFELVSAIVEAVKATFRASEAYEMYGDTVEAFIEKAIILETIADILATTVACCLSFHKLLSMLHGCLLRPCLQSLSFH